MDDAGNQYILAVTDQGQAHCNIGDFGAPVGGMVDLNEWTHVACVYDRVAVRVYVNGEEVAAAPATQPIPASSMPLGIGRAESNTSRNFDGLIDEVEIFNRALTRDEIQAIYEAGSQGKIKLEPPTPGKSIDPPEGMVGWWPGDDSPNDSQKYNVLVAKGIGLVGNEWYVRQRGDTGLFLEWAFVDTGSNLVFGATSAGIAAGVFHHLALVRSGATGRLYLDGEQVDADSEPDLGDISNPHDLLIGADNRLLAGDFADVTIDEVEIFNRALRGEEIRAIYNAGSAGKIKPPPPPPPEPIPPPAGMVTGGKVDQAFSFDGTVDSVIVAHGPSLNVTDFTFDAWVKPNRTTPGQWQGIITKNVGPRPPSLWLYDTNIVRSPSRRPPAW